MSVIRDIKRPIQEEMLHFESKFKEAMRSPVPLLDKIMHYIIKRKGKQMRPMFVFLSAKRLWVQRDAAGELQASTPSAGQCWQRC